MPSVARAVLAAAALAGAAVAAAALLDVPGDVNNTRDAEDWSLNRVRGVSAEAVTTALLREAPGAAEAYARLGEYFQDAIEDENCALRDNQWVKDLTGFAGLRDWPVPDTSCVSSTRLRRTDMRFSPAEYIGMLREYVRVLRVVADKVVAGAGPRNFSKPTVPRDWPFESGKYKRCVLERATGVRFRPAGGGRDQWYFVSGISNDDTNLDFPQWDRQFINEYVGVDSAGEFVNPLTMNLRGWPGPGGVSENQSLPRGKYATSFEMWGGRVGLSAIYNMDKKDSPALVQALDLSEIDANQAADALTPSNVGILALPMALNVIPVALVADVSTVGLFVYTIMTDVLTTVPFIIKGFELLISGSKKYISHEVWYAGRRTDAWIVAEGWAAECELQGVRSIGVTFIAIGFAFLFVGVFAEWQARRLRMRWTVNGTLGKAGRSHLKAALLQRDLRVEAGLRPDKPSNPDVLEEEQAFLDNQTRRQPPPIAHL